MIKRRRKSPEKLNFREENKLSQSFVNGFKNNNGR